MTQDKRTPSESITPEAVHSFAGVDPRSPEGHLRSVLWDILGGMGAESVESAAQRVVRDRDLQRDLYEAAEHGRKLQEARAEKAEADATNEDHDRVSDLLGRWKVDSAFGFMVRGQIARLLAQVRADERLRMGQESPSVADPRELVYRLGLCVEACEKELASIMKMRSDPHGESGWRHTRTTAKAEAYADAKEIVETWIRTPVEPTGEAKTSRNPKDGAEERARDAALATVPGTGQPTSGGALPPGTNMTPDGFTVIDPSRPFALPEEPRPANVSPPRELRSLVQSVLAWDHDCADCEPAKEFHTGTLYHEKECAYWEAVTALAAAVGLGDMFARETAEQLDGQLGYRRVRFAEDRRPVEPRMADGLPTFSAATVAEMSLRARNEALEEAHKAIKIALNAMRMPPVKEGAVSESEAPKEK